MFVYTKGQTRISFIHKLLDENGKFKKYTFRIWMGKSGIGKNCIDRYKTGSCFQELDIPMTEFNCQGKQYKKAVLFNAEWEIFIYTSDKLKRECEVWKLMKFDKQQVQNEVQAENEFTEDNF